MVTNAYTHHPGLVIGEAHEDMLPIDGTSFGCDLPVKAALSQLSFILGKPFGSLRPRRQKQEDKDAN